jgi:hypothetical protein
MRGNLRFETLSLTAMWALTPWPLAANDCAPINTDIGVTYAQNIRLSGAVTSGALGEAIGMWNGTCGSRIPKFVTTGPGIPVTVHADPGPNSLPPSLNCSGCGCAFPRFTGPSGNQTLQDGIIWVFGKRADGTPCHNPIQIFAHELGHILGFENGSCSGRIMGPSLSASVGVTSADCGAIDGMWMTPMEEQTSGPSQPDPGMPTPLILDLNHDGRILTTGLSSPVWFDFEGHGIQQRLTWTFWESEEGFLWIDLNESGTVDDGGELFGSSTILPSGKNAEHGFEALGIYDAPENGGNADGILSDLDRVWRRLRLWVDRNHDGVSQRDETETLRDRGVVAIGLEYIVSDMVDGCGNGHFFQGYFVTHSDALGFTTRRYQVMHDVFFRLVED